MLKYIGGILLFTGFYFTENVHTICANVNNNINDTNCTISTSSNETKCTSSNSNETNYTSPQTKVMIVLAPSYKLYKGLPISYLTEILFSNFTMTTTTY